MKYLDINKTGTLHMQKNSRMVTEVRCGIIKINWRTKDANICIASQTKNK